MNNKNILIFGGSGYIGTHLVKKLVDNEYNVIVYDVSKPLNLPSIFFEKIKFFSGSIDDLSEIEKILRNNRISIVIDLVCSILPANYSIEDFSLINNSLNSKIKLINLLVNLKNITYVYMSSGGTVYGRNGLELCNEDCLLNPINYYGWLKMTEEKYIQVCNKIHGLNYIILRPSNIYGKNYFINQSQGLISVFLSHMLAGKELEIWGDGSVIRDYLFIDDFIKIVVNLLSFDLKNQILNIGSGQGYSISEILEIMKKIRKNVKIKYRLAREVDIPVNILDISKLKSIVPVEIKTIEEGINLSWDFIVKRNKL